MSVAVDEAGGEVVQVIEEVITSEGANIAEEDVDEPSAAADEDDGVGDASGNGDKERVA